MRFLYGIDDNKLDITNRVLYKCVANDVIHIPKFCYTRDYLFTDPLPGVHKFVYIELENETIKLDEFTPLTLDAESGRIITDGPRPEIEPSLLVNGFYKPKLCFATMCKNEEHVIRDVLNSVYKHIDYWVVCDTGSTDKTCEVVIEFFKEKNIPGELYHDEWVGFSHNKSLLMKRCYKKMDYILHIDADDLLEGNFEFKIREHKSGFYLRCRNRGGSVYKRLFIFNSNLHWKFVSVVHERATYTDLGVELKEEDYSDRDFWINIRTLGARSVNPNKYLHDALKLQDQFFDSLPDDRDDLVNRSAFYTAASYFDQGMFKESYQWYRLFSNLLDTWIEEQYEAGCRLCELSIIMKMSLKKVLDEVEKTSAILPDRAEHLFRVGKYLNDIRENSLAYKYLTQAKQHDLSVAKQKYRLFVVESCYGKHINDELAVACYHTKRYKEGRKLLEEIIDDPDFALKRDRLTDNLRFMKRSMGAEE
jgi:glycosyltransferase involved in cell wall biosynthesis